MAALLSILNTRSKATGCELTAWSAPHHGILISRIRIYVLSMNSQGWRKRVNIIGEIAIKVKALEVKWIGEWKRCFWNRSLGASNCWSFFILLLPSHTWVPLSPFHDDGHSSRKRPVLAPRNARQLSRWSEAIFFTSIIRPGKYQCALSTTGRTERREWGKK